MKLPDPPRAGKVVLEVVDLAKAFGPKIVFEDVTFDVGRGERLLVLGLNGAGKTTLLRSLVGELEPELGEVRLGHEVSMGYYAQEHEGITPGRSVLEHIREQSGLADQYLRGLLGMFGLRGELAFQDAGTLSGGEKTKLALDDARRRRAQPAPARRADEQPRPAVAHRDRRRAARLEGRDGAREPRHRIRHRARARTACC